MSRTVNYGEYSERLSRVLTDESRDSGGQDQSSSSTRKRTKPTLHAPILSVDASESEEEPVTTKQAKVRKTSRETKKKGDTREVHLYGQCRDSLRLQAFGEELGLNIIVNKLFVVIALGHILKKENRNFSC